MSESTVKRFPANTTLDELTFLNDKSIDGELYAYLQELSKPILNSETKVIETIVMKKEMPTQAKICEVIGIKSPKTLKVHLDYLIEKNYIEVRDGNYILLEQENIFFMIPLNTIKYLTDNCREHVIKIYVYLGQRHKWALSLGKPYYEFTLEELGQHIGIKIKNNSRGYEIINNALDLLYNSNLIDYCSYFDGSMQKKKLLKFSLVHSVKDR